MGGVGSGNWCRRIKKISVGGVKSIDVRYIKKCGLLNPGTQGFLSWTCGGEPGGDIFCVCHQHELQLCYRYRKSGGYWRSVEQRIPLDRTSCNYGGERPWFRCPGCNKRVAVLYGADMLFLCRYCYRLPYESQQVDKASRLISQKHKLGERIFERYECGVGWGKKKGMHWRTFERHRKHYQALEQKYLVSLVQRFPHLKEGEI